MQPFKGLWDTGATASVIDQRVVTACGLKPTGMTQVHTAAGMMNAETFLVNIALPNGVSFHNVEVTLGNVFGADLLIGMDIITAGDFSITNQNKTTVFSFRTPSPTTVGSCQGDSAPPARDRETEEAQEGPPPEDLQQEAPLDPRHDRPHRG